MQNVIVSQSRWKAAATIETRLTQNGNLVDEHEPVDRWPDIGFELGQIPEFGDDVGPGGLQGVQANGGPVNYDDFARAMAYSRIEMSDTRLQSGYINWLQCDVKSSGYEAYTRANSMAFCEQYYEHAQEGSWQWLFQISLNSTITADVELQSKQRHRFHVHVDSYNNVTAVWKPQAKHWHIYGTLMDTLGNPSSFSYTQNQLSQSLAAQPRTLNDGELIANVSYNYKGSDWFPDIQGGPWQSGYGHVLETDGPAMAENHSGGAELRLFQVMHAIP